MSEATSLPSAQNSQNENGISLVKIFQLNGK